MRKNPTQKLSPLQKKRLVRATIIFIFLGLIWLFFSPGSGLFSVYTTKKDLAALQLENEKMTEENANFQEEIDKMKNDPEYLEDVARRNYGLLKPNERVYDFSKPKNTEKE